MNAITNALTNITTNITILSLPNEVICEISRSIELPADIVKFSLTCSDFYACRNIHLLKWISTMRNVIKEINAISYKLCDSNNAVLEISFRIRGKITTAYHLYVPSSKLDVIQGFPPERITEYQIKHLNRISLFKPNPRSRRTDVVLSHDVFNRYSNCRIFTSFYENLIL